MIRKAEPRDIPQIVAMARKFYVTTEYAAFAPMGEQTVADLTAMLIDTGIMLVADDGAELTGIVALVVTPFYFNNAVTTAHEVLWWVDPEAQGAGIGKALLEAIETACRGRGVKAVQMIHLASSPPQAAAIYERYGYRASESCYTKEL